VLFHFSGERYNLNNRLTNNLLIISTTFSILILNMLILWIREREQLRKLQVEQSHKPRDFERTVSQMEHDGTILTSRRDPPRQRSVYIKPGDTRRELYRLTTFEKFPLTSPINPCQLASQGFYYLGYKDRVKCFDCAQTVENWTSEDDPLSTKWHQTHCQFVKKNNSTQIYLFLRSNNKCKIQKTHQLRHRIHNKQKILRMHLLQQLQTLHGIRQSTLLRAIQILGSCFLVLILLIHICDNCGHVC